MAWLKVGRQWKSGRKVNGFVICRQSPLTNTTAEMLSFNLRLQNLGSQFSQLGWNKQWVGKKKKARTAGCYQAWDHRATSMGHGGSCGGTWWQPCIGTQWEPCGSHVLGCCCGRVGSWLEGSRSPRQPRSCFPSKEPPGDAMACFYGNYEHGKNKCMHL